MKTKIETAILENSVTPDATRAATIAYPLRVISGRGLVDACGRVILRAHARQLLTADGGTPYSSEADGALSPCEADANAHAIAHTLNNAELMRQALQAYVLTLDYMQRTVNAEEWATHGNWSRLAADANAALGATATPAVVDLGPLNALRANMRHAVFNRETCTIGGGDFSYSELRAVLAILDALAPGGDA
jgi:hypothetical protein